MKYILLLIFFYSVSVSISAQSTLVIVVEGDDYLMTHIEDFLREDLISTTTNRRYFDAVINISQVDENIKDINTAARVIIKSNNGLSVDLKTSQLDLNTAEAVSKYTYFLKIKIKPLVELIEYQFKLYKRNTALTGDTQNDVVILPNNNQKPEKSSNFFINPKSPTYLKDLEFGIYKLFPIAFEAPEAEIYLNNSPLSMVSYYPSGDSICLEARFLDKKTQFDAYTKHEWLIQSNCSFPPFEWRATGPLVALRLDVPCKYKITLNTLNDVKEMDIKSYEFDVIDRPVISLQNDYSDVFTEIESVFPANGKARKNHFGRIKYNYKISASATNKQLQISSIIKNELIKNTISQSLLTDRIPDSIINNQRNNVMAYELLDSLDKQVITLNYNLMTSPQKRFGKSRFDYKAQVNTNGISSTPVVKKVYITTYSPFRLGVSYTGLYFPNTYPVTIKTEAALLKKMNTKFANLSTFDVQLQLLPNIALYYMQAIPQSYVFPEATFRLSTVDGLIYESNYNDRYKLKNGFGTEFRLPLSNSSGSSSSFSCALLFFKYDNYSNLPERYSEAQLNLGQPSIETYEQVLTQTNRSVKSLILFGTGSVIHLHPFIIPIKIQIGIPFNTKIVQATSIGLQVGIAIDPFVLFRPTLLRTQRKQTYNSRV